MHNPLTKDLYGVTKNVRQLRNLKASIMFWSGGLLSISVLPYAKVNTY